MNQEARDDIKQWMRKWGDQIPMTARTELNKTLEKHAGASTVSADQVQDAKDAVEFSHDQSEEGLGRREDPEEKKE